MLKQVATFAEKQTMSSEMNVELEDDKVIISIRDGKDDEPSKQAVADSTTLIRVIRREFENAIKIDADTDDEWVNITVTLK